MLSILGLVATIVSILLMMIILVQRGKGGGLTGALGGMGGQSAFGAKAGDVFTRVTVIAAIIWMTSCLLIIRIYNPPPARAASKSGAEISAFEEDSNEGAGGGGLSSGVLDTDTGGLGELLENDPLLSEDPDDDNDFNPGLPGSGEGTGSGDSDPMLEEEPADNSFLVDPDAGGRTTSPEPSDPETSQNAEPGETVEPGETIIEIEESGEPAPSDSEIIDTLLERVEPSSSALTPETPDGQ